jgi:hypothetical protein
MKTKNETVERSSLIELILTPEMSIEEIQDICKEKIHAFPNIFRNGEMCSIDTTFRDLGLSEEHNISVKPTNDVGDIIQAFEKIIKDKKTHMFFYYADRPWAIMLGDVKIKETSKLPSLIKSWLLSIAMKFAIKYVD